MKKITADYIVGFTDGEGCFSLHITKREKSPFGVCVTPSFSLSQNTTSIQVFYDIQFFFGCGFIRPDRQTSKYEIRDLIYLEQKIIPFFKKHKLRTQKSQDFAKFCEICELIRQKKHFELSGMMKLLDLAYSMNNSGSHRRKTKMELLEEIKKWKPKNV